MPTSEETAKVQIIIVVGIICAIVFVVLAVVK